MKYPYISEIIGYKYTRRCLWNATTALNSINPSVGGATVDL